MSCISRELVLKTEEKKWVLKTQEKNSCQKSQNMRFTGHINLVAYIIIHLECTADYVL